MENRDVLIDTSIFIDFLRKKRKEQSLLWRVLDRGYACFVSVVTVFELYAGAVTEHHVRELDVLLDWFLILTFNAKIAKTSAEIYRVLRHQNQLIEFRDIFIGATAVVHSLPIVTLNEGDFQRIPNLAVLDLSMLQA